MRLFGTTILTAAALFLIGCSSDQASQETPVRVTEEQSTVTSELEQAASRGSLLFFMNPHGRPCQIQDQYLKQVQSEIEPMADIVYVKTTVRADKNLFYQYGIRSLPALVLLDDKDQVARRFTPGIQNGNTILTVLQDVL